jgi:hypothetical protein
MCVDEIDGYTCERPPTIETFSASATVLPADEPTDVAWSWTYADSPSPTPTCRIDQGIGDVTSRATVSVTVAQDTHEPWVGSLRNQEQEAKEGEPAPLSWDRP